MSKKKTVSAVLVLTPNEAPWERLVYQLNKWEHAYDCACLKREAPASSGEWESFFDHEFPFLLKVYEGDDVPVAGSIKQYIKSLLAQNTAEVRAEMEEKLCKAIEVSDTLARKDERAEIRDKIEKYQKKCFEVINRKRENVRTKEDFHQRYLALGNALSLLDEPISSNS